MLAAKGVGITGGRKYREGKKINTLQGVLSGRSSYSAPCFGMQLEAPGAGRSSGTENCRTRKNSIFTLFFLSFALFIYVAFPLSVSY